ncbi:MAG TPA: acylphosphatase [Ruminococcaceae bacterium]|nr:acylphosphatase [Oscillospiraceae bacterium]
MSNEPIIRKAIIFYGWVQGVGFRYRAYHAAEQSGATGWVKNNYDGSVSMEIQGTETQIDNVLLAIERGTYVRIENLDCKTIPVDPEERRFKIR